MVKPTIDEYVPTKCPFVVRDGSCAKCPHLRKETSKRDGCTPICYRKPEDAE